MRATHDFGPFFNSDSRILILGSFPSIKSRDEGFYYAHPQNRFWRVLATVFHDEIPTTLDEKKALLMRHKIALWDVIESCDITGSSDSSIKNAIPCDLLWLTTQAPIVQVYCLGKTSEKYFLKWHPDFPLPMTTLPSTSGANAQYSLEDLVLIWSKAMKMFDLRV